jgi:uncharacterized protein YbjQ (UPF0145 family)
MSYICPKCETKNFSAFCHKCGEQIVKTEPYESPDQKCKKSAKKILLTTTSRIEGYKTLNTLDVITAECFFGLNMVRYVLAGIRDYIGGRSETVQKLLRDARNQCLYELRKEAYLLGANAVVGVDLNYSEFSGGGQAMLFLVASGTAVKIEKIE